MHRKTKHPDPCKKITRWLYILRGPCRKRKVPGDLSGKYTSLDNAKKAIQVYLNNITPSKAVRREAFGKDYEERKKRNATESNAEGS